MFLFFLFIDFSMPGTFQMVPLKMSILDIEGTKTYFFKVMINNFFLLLLFIEFQARLPNNKYVNVRIRLSGNAEPRDNQVAVESRASGDLDEEITKIFQKIIH